MEENRDSPKITWPAGMSDASKDELREFLYEYDRALSDFEKDHTVIFPSREERLRLFYASRKRWSKNWATPGSCMHEGCGATAIPRSHTVPMSASLKVIAENGHVVTPRFGESGIEMVRVGIREASTFPGSVQLTRRCLQVSNLKNR